MISSPNNSTKWTHELESNTDATSFKGNSSHIVSIHARALEVCYLIYGEASLSSQVLDRFYESGASMLYFQYRGHTNNLVAAYQNPAVSAMSRDVIHDIFKLGRKIHGLDIPRPLAAVCALIGVEPPTFVQRPMFQALRAWNDVGTISEHESFDGQKQAIVEHTLNLLFLPAAHIDSNPNAAMTFPMDPRRPQHDHLHNMSSPNYHPGQPSVIIPGTSMSFASPLHFKLPIITRLSFNEQGRITQHRDYWDVKDLMNLCPGMSMAQWLGSRIVAVSLSYAYRLLPKGPHEGGNDHLDRAFNDVGLQGLVVSPNRDPNH